jgi:hypothetical protein
LNAPNCRSNTLTRVYENGDCSSRDACNEAFGSTEIEIGSEDIEVDFTELAEYQDFNAILEKII